MIVRCPECSASFNISDSNIGATSDSTLIGNKAVALAKVVRCPSCLKNLYPGRALLVVSE
jgi:hypothetical protein